MRVAKFLNLCFALLAVVCITVVPIYAGGIDPWNEGDGSGNGDTSGQGGGTPGVPNVTTPTGTTPFFGTSLWWLDLIWNGNTDGGGTTSLTAAKPNVEKQAKPKPTGGKLR